MNFIVSGDKFTLRVKKRFAAILSPASTACEPICNQTPNSLESNAECFTSLSLSCDVISAKSPFRFFCKIPVISGV